MITICQKALYCERLMRAQTSFFKDHSRETGDIQFPFLC